MEFRQNTSRIESKMREEVRQVIEKAQGQNLLTLSIFVAVVGFLIGGIQLAMTGAGDRFEVSDIILILFALTSAILMVVSGLTLLSLVNDPPKEKPRPWRVIVRRISIVDLLRRHRSKMNGPNGYGVLSLSKECMRYLESTTLECEGMTGVLLFTDGFGAIEQYMDYDVEALFRESERRGLEDVIREIRELERGDESLVSFPRLKQHDDASALLLEIEDSFSQCNARP